MDLISHPTLDSDVIDMDTILPPHAVIYRSSPKFISVDPLSLKDPFPYQNHAIGSSSHIRDSQKKRTFLSSDAVSIELPLLSAPVDSTSANFNPAIETCAMDTTPSSQALIFHSSLVSTENYSPFSIALLNSENIITW